MNFLFISSAVSGFTSSLNPFGPQAYLSQVDVQVIPELLCLGLHIGLSPKDSKRPLESALLGASKPDIAKSFKESKSISFHMCLQLLEAKHEPSY